MYIHFCFQAKNLDLQLKIKVCMCKMVNKGLVS